MTAEELQLGLRRLRLATLLQFALPGVPCIYYGDEAGLEGYKDPFNRATYPWGREDADLLDWYRRLGAARRGCDALVDGDFEPLSARRETVAFVRRSAQGALLCAVNRSHTEQTIPLPPSFAEARPIAGECRVEEGRLILAPLSGVWLSSEAN